MSSSNNNMNNLTTLIKRLEAATSRLEDMVPATAESHAVNGIAVPKGLAAITTSSVTTPPAPPAPPAPPVAPKADPVPESVEDFDTFISEAVTKYVKQSEAIGGSIAKQAGAVLRGFQTQRTFLLISTKSKKPDVTDPAYMTLLKPIQEQMTAVTEIRDQYRGKPELDQLSTVSDGISVLAWVTLDSKPYKHVDECLGSAQYYGNRVMKEYKEKDPKVVEWLQAYYNIFRSLSEYAKNTFPNGIVWNAKGLPPLDAMKAVSKTAGPPSPAPSSAPSAGGPPPPPPPPPPPVIDVGNSAPPAAASGIGAVFSELNKGEAVTSGLRKVTADQMTHKNPSLRAGATVPTRSESSSSIGRKSPVPGKKPKPESMRTKKPPKKELEGNKWLVENYDGESQPVVINAEATHSIMISRCNKTTIIIKGKANAISVDNCARLSLVVDTLISSVDVIKASNFALQVMDTLPTILMDQVDGAQIYLGLNSMNTELISSKSSGININVMEGEDEDYKELALPEQIRTYFGKDGKITSEIMEHSG